MRHLLAQWSKRKQTFQKILFIVKGQFLIKTKRLKRKPASLLVLLDMLIFQSIIVLKLENRQFDIHFDFYSTYVFMNTHFMIFLLGQIWKILWLILLHEPPHPLRPTVDYLLE